MVHRMQYTTLLKSRIKYNNVNERNQIRVRPHIQNVHQNAYSRHISPVQADFSLSLLLSVCCFTLTIQRIFLFASFIYLLITLTMIMVYVYVRSSTAQQLS